MKEIMTPSTVTDEQIDKVGDVARAGVRKHRKEFPLEAVQKALSSKGLAQDILAVFRKHVEMFVEMIVRIVKVNRSRSPEEAIAATDRKQYVSDEVLKNMPRGEGDEAEVVFFKLNLFERGGYISNDDLEKEFELRGLRPADPYSLSAVNEADPAFAD